MITQTYRINVSEVLAPVISFRDLVELLKEEILRSPGDQVVLDFSSVEFVSRSATHEMLVMKEDLARKKPNSKEVSFVNANPGVTEMFRLVAANRAFPKEEGGVFLAEQIDVGDLSQHFGSTTT